MTRKNLNYNHLYYFWTVARLGSVSRACDELSLAQSTISAQIRFLEQDLGERLFTKRGRNLALTEAGEIALRYCNQLFQLGTEMHELIEGKANSRPELLRIGVSDTVPKMLIHQMLEPVMNQSEPTKLVITESSAERLLSDLAIHTVDAVILDCPMPPSVYVRAYNHLMMESGVSFICHPSTYKKYRGNFPTSLNDAPMLLPTHAAAVRVELDRWFEKTHLTPNIVAEFQDSALMKLFGKNGAGVFPIPTVIEDDICRELGCKVVGRIDTMMERYFLITTEKRLRNRSLRLIGRSSETLKRVSSMDCN